MIISRLSPCPSNWKKIKKHIVKSRQRPPPIAKMTSDAHAHDAHVYRPFGGRHVEIDDDWISHDSRKQLGGRKIAWMIEDLDGNQQPHTYIDSPGKVYMG